MAYQFLTCTVEASLATVTLNRPDKRNALSTALREELVRCLEALAAEEEVKVVILTGAGTTFCAGFDLSELATGDRKAIFAQAQAYHHRVYTFPKPLLAAVNGAALAGGMDLAIMCDLRIAAETAVFGQPQVRMGIPAAYELLRTVLPETVVRELCLTGRRLDAQEALRLGLVNRVVSAARLLEETCALAQEVATSGASLAMKARFLQRQPSLFTLGVQA